MATIFFDWSNNVDGNWLMMIVVDCTWFKLIFETIVISMDPWNGINFNESLTDIIQKNELDWRNDNNCNWSVK